MEKRKKKSVALANRLSCQRYRCYSIRLSWVDCWLAGWRLKPEKVPGVGKEETRCFNTSTQAAASSKPGFRGTEEKREKVQHTLCSEWATQQPLGKNLASTTTTSVFKPSKTPKRSHRISKLHVQEGGDGVTAGSFRAKRSNRDKRLVATPSVTGWLIRACESPTHGRVRKTGNPRGGKRRLRLWQVKCVTNRLG